MAEMAVVFLHGRMQRGTLEPTNQTSFSYGVVHTAGNVQDGPMQTFN
jgi:hypothetical protein